MLAAVKERFNPISLQIANLEVTQHSGLRSFNVRCFSQGPPGELEGTLLLVHQGPLDLKHLKGDKILCNMFRGHSDPRPPMMGLLGKAAVNFSRILVE